MGEVFISSAYLGDERSAVKVTDSLTQKLLSSYDNSVDVDSKLIPIVQVEGSTALTDDQVREAQERAELDCEGATDNSCVEIKSQEYLRKMIKEKLNSVQSSANLVKGRRMVVTLNVDGEDRTYVIPEGQKFKLDPSVIGDRKLVDPYGLAGDAGVGEISAGDIFGELGVQLLKALGVIAATAVYVFSVVATYKVFIQAGYTIVAYIATASAVFIPYSGIFITLGFFALKEFIQNRPKNITSE
jgi:hypothetical protein